MIEFDKKKYPSIVCEVDYKDLPIVQLGFSPMGRDDKQYFPIVLSTESSYSLFDEVFADALDIDIDKCQEYFFNETSYRGVPVMCRLPNKEEVALMAYINHSEKMNKTSCNDLTKKVGIILDSSKILFFN